MSNNRHKTAIVTGGASGIGLAIAEKFVQAGITTIIVGRDQQKLDAAKTKLGKQAIAMQADLSDLSAIPYYQALSFPYAPN